MTGLCARCKYKDACGTPNRTMPCEGRVLVSKAERCVICGKPIIGAGNNPAPVRVKGRCCDACNMNVVVPARIMVARGATIKEI